MKRTIWRPYVRRRAAGVTLIEMLVTLVLMVILSAAISNTFVASLDLERTQARRRSSADRIDQIERRIRTLLRGARLADASTTATTTQVGGQVTSQDYTYFIAETIEGDADMGCDRITFTSVSPGVSLSAQESVDDFETQHDASGPVGGMAEVSLSTTAVGDAGSRTGLFERIQRPADEDATQGGEESALATEIDRIGFQFYDGAEWITEWDTTVDANSRRLPAAVQVSYTLKDDPTGVVHRFVVVIPSSDVTADNPLVQGTSS